MSCRTKFCKRFFLICSLLVIALVVLGLPQAVFAQNLDDPLGAFQMDGNAVKDPGTQTSGVPPLLCFGTDLSGAPAESYDSSVNDTGGCPSLGTFAPVTFGTTTDDWSQVKSGTGGHFIAHSFQTDAAGGNSDPTTFLGTSTKDTMPISQWAWQAHSVQSKDDIEHAYAAAYNVSGQTFLYAGMDRFANSGDSTAGFWFIQDSTFDLCTAANVGSRGPNAGCTAGGTFAGNHTDGDLLIVSDFSQGGAVSTINIFIWAGGPNGTLPTTPNLTISPAPCNPGVAGGTRNDVCGLVNNAYVQQVVHGKEALVPALVATGGWSFFDVKNNTKFATGEFLELGINLDNPSLFGSTPPCFSTFMAETRSSTSVGSSLSDLAAPVSFPLCSITPTKQCGGIANTPTSTIITLSGANCLTGEVCDGRPVVRYTFSGSIASGGKTLFHPNLTDNPPGVLAGAYVAHSLEINGAQVTPGVAVDLLPAGTGFSTVNYTGQFDSNSILDDNSRNSITATASSSSTGTPQNVGPDTTDWGPTKTNLCNPTPAPGLEMAKLCNSCLTGTTTLTVTVDEGIKVCNSGNVPIGSVKVKDCQGAAWQNGICNSPGVEKDFASVDLTQAGTAGACHLFNNSYSPNSSNVTSCTATGTSGCSMDSVIASGTISSNFCTPGVPAGNTCGESASAMATCPLCPLGAVGSCTTYNGMETGFGIP